MALNIAPQGFASGIKLYRQTSTNATPTKNVTNGPATLYCVVMDNSANGAATFVKLYNDANPTVGTTAPSSVYKVPASSIRTVYVPSGIVYATALSFAAVTAGGTAGTTSPTSAVPVNIIASE